MVRNIEPNTYSKRETNMTVIIRRGRKSEILTNQLPEIREEREGKRKTGFF